MKGGKIRGCGQNIDFSWVIFRARTASETEELRTLYRRSSVLWRCRAGSILHEIFKLCSWFDKLGYQGRLCVLLVYDIQELRCWDPLTVTRWTISLFRHKEPWKRKAIFFFLFSQLPLVVYVHKLSNSAIPSVHWFYHLFTVSHQLHIFISFLFQFKFHSHSL